VGFEGTFGFKQYSDFGQKSVPPAHAKIRSHFALSTGKWSAGRTKCRIKKIASFGYLS
jgi:hypothetical protein